MNAANDFKVAVKRLLQERGMSQAELAKQVGISSQYLSLLLKIPSAKKETGESRGTITLDLAEKISAALGTTINRLLTSGEQEEGLKNDGEVKYLREKVGELEASLSLSKQSITQFKYVLQNVINQMVAEFVNAKGIPFPVVEEADRAKVRSFLFKKSWVQQAFLMGLVPNEGYIEQWKIWLGENELPNPFSDDSITEIEPKEIVVSLKKGGT